LKGEHAGYEAEIKEFWEKINFESGDLGQGVPDDRCQNQRLFRHGRSNLPSEKQTHLAIVGHRCIDPT
jgi:hypothetical protein